MNRVRVICLVAVGLIAASGAATAGSGPMADAGLDQTVSVNTTVQLDATGSTHPNGDIERYEWRIETPDGRMIRPECRQCARTAFRPDTVGRYAVTVTVSDSEGETASDTLYVDVEGTPGDSRNVTETPDGEADFDPVGSDTQNEEPRNTIQLDGNNVGGSVSEINYETTIEINQCNAGSETGTGYTNSGNIDDCTDPEAVWEREETTESIREVTIKVDNYEREDGGSLLPTGNNQVPLKNSEGMGQEGHLDHRVEIAHEAESNTGLIERALFGEKSTEAMTYTTTGEAAHTTANLDSLNTQYHENIGQSGGMRAGFQEVEQTSGPSGEKLSNTDKVEVTVKRAEGTGILNHLGVTDTYSREDFNSDRSVTIDIAGNIASDIYSTVESSSNLLSGSDDGGEASSSDESIATSTPQDTTLDDGPSSVDADHNSGPTWDDSGSRGVGHSTGGGPSGGSSNDNPGGSSSTDWKLPDDLGANNDAGYATAP